jgi:MerR family transcriptional regulator, thiopeptide resistance regulator
VAPVTLMAENESTANEVRIGALAQATGVTVRTLHHYDAIGLLVPDARSPTGRRLYSQPNVRRLYQIVALRRLGLSLEEIAGTLDQNPDLIETVRQHLARVEQGLELQRRLQRTLTQVLEQFERDDQPTLDQFTQAIEVMTMIEDHYTPEQRAQLEQRREALGEEGIRQAERDWAMLIETVKTERANGTEPTAARMLELARQWQTLIEQFTGGDEGMGRSLAAMYREQGPKAASRGMVEPELMQYVGQALAALQEAQ